jgi:hypothetical protein
VGTALGVARPAGVGARRVGASGAGEAGAVGEAKSGDDVAACDAPTVEDIPLRRALRHIRRRGCVCGFGGKSMKARMLA